MNEKICFIICASNEIYLNECTYYIKNLKCPHDMEVDIICIRGAESMCGGYNEGMKQSDAKYKIYLHQDVFIRNRNFIPDIVNIFRSDPSIGMIGMVGGIGMPQNAVTYLAWNAGCVDTREPDAAYRMICAPNQEKDMAVDAIDGLLIATQVDISWREDLFQNFDFYDVSQSFEMRRAGYKIVVPYQREPWVIHECNYAKLENYDSNRKICQKEYPEFLTEQDDFEFVYHREWEELSDELADIVGNLVEKQEWKQIDDVLSVYRKGQMKNSRLEMYAVMLELAIRDSENQHKPAFFDGLHILDEMMEKYCKTRFRLLRMECDMPELDYEDLKDKIYGGTLSFDSVINLILHFSLDKSKVLRQVENWYHESGNQGAVSKIEMIIRNIERTGPILAYSKRAAKDLPRGKK